MIKFSLVLFVLSGLAFADVSPGAIPLKVQNTWPDRVQFYVKEGEDFTPLFEQSFDESVLVGISNTEYRQTKNSTLGPHPFAILAAFGLMAGAYTLSECVTDLVAAQGTPARIMSLAVASTVLVGGGLIYVRHLYLVNRRELDRRHVKTALQSSEVKQVNRNFIDRLQKALSGRRFADLSRVGLKIFARGGGRVNLAD